MHQRLPLRFLFLRTLSVAALLGAGWPPSAVAAEATAAGMLGFSEAGAREQAALERRFDTQISAADLRAWDEQMSSAPNHVGAPHNRANAEFMLSQFRAWGWEARIEEFQILYPTPTKVGLELVAPVPFTAKLREPPVAGDRTSGQVAGQLPPYNAYGADGDVTGELVYVNHGMPDDYEQLARQGIEVRGRIVIARYGGGWRGLKPKLAHEHGAIGCLIYSDPRDDGFGAGDSYPDGPYRPADGVQRGSVMDMPIYPGDPLTPGIGATAGARRLPLAEAKTVLKIPVLPISHADAQPLLAALKGPVAPPTWRGGLPLTYHVGPGPAKVRLTVASDWSLKPAYNVIAVLTGRERPDEWVLRGNHHDAWVFGADDPLSGNAALMAEVKAIGALARSGWRPRRTLVYASWDAEEPGLIGSTEWAEAHADELRRKAVAYVNSDSNGRGFLQAAGSHALQTLVNQVAAAVRDPQTGATVQERRRAKLMVDGTRKGAEAEAQRIARRMADGAPPPLGALGSGSDFTVFLDHLGIASLNLGFGGESETGGVYHSAYDSFDHYIRFGDPDFSYGVLLSKIAGRVMLRLANADVLPLRLGDFAETVAEYAGEVHRLAETMRAATEVQNRMVGDNQFKLAADPKRSYVPPGRDAAVPVLNLAPLDNAVIRLKASARTGDAALAAAVRTGTAADETRRARLDAVLRGLEPALLHAPGLPGREWFRHMIYAPGLKTGYGVKTLPGVREAIEERRWAEAEKYAAVIAGVLNAYCDRIDEAVALVPKLSAAAQP